MIVQILTKENICKNLFGIFLLSFAFQFPIISFSQNLIVNGSMNGTPGSDTVALGWQKYSNSSENTPDINDASGPLYTTGGYSWIGGTPATLALDLRMDFK